MSHSVFIYTSIIMDTIYVNLRTICMRSLRTMAGSVGMGDRGNIMVFMYVDQYRMEQPGLSLVTTYCGAVGGLVQDSKYASRIKYLSKKFGGVELTMTSFPSAKCSRETSSSVSRSRIGEEAMIPMHNRAGH